MVSETFPPGLWIAFGVILAVLILVAGMHRRARRNQMHKALKEQQKQVRGLERAIEQNRRSGGLLRGLFLLILRVLLLLAAFFTAFYFLQNS